MIISRTSNAPFTPLTHALLALLAALAAQACADGGFDNEERDANEKVINGQAENNYPEVALLQAYQHMCSGTLISPRVVLTAAHCTDGPFIRQVTFYQGAQALDQINVSDHVIHTDWQGTR